MPIRAKVYIVVTAGLGAAALGMSCAQWHSDELLKFACYLVFAVLASVMKVRLPGMESTMSVSFLFILLGVKELTLAETLLIGCSGTLLQSLWKTQRPPAALKVVFNVLGNTAVAAWCSYFVYHALARYFPNGTPILMVLAAFVYFLCNTLSLSAVIALDSKGSMRKIWTETYLWGLPYNLAGGAVVYFVSVGNRYIGWQNVLLIAPIMYVIYRSYVLYLGRLEDQKKRIESEEQQVQAEKRHVEEVCELHLRTIEGLALAIDAKDHTTHEHLHRVRAYAMEIGKELGLDDDNLEALRSAALLHDIGKLAVPDYIISKPGRLTPEEFEKMKIHASVGADILEKVAFPYPVARIVRSHHEKWNGKGYPDGLKGEEIPIGARILGAVDCLDALSSDRHYRKALPLEVAMKTVAQESGESFDPKVVNILQRRFLELESYTVHSLNDASNNLHISYNRTERGEHPGAGFEANINRPNGSRTDFLASIASARQEAHTLFELSQDLGNSLSLNETLSLVAMRLRKLVPFDSVVVFVRKGDLLAPEFVCGDNFRFLSALEIQVGTGLSGWVAQNSMPIINGNPSVETNFMDGPRRTTDLRSALAVPLEGINGMVGVLTLYHAEADKFTNDHLRVLQVITSKVAHFIENALTYRQAEISATNDFLTGLPNARALSMYLDQELARWKQDQLSVAIIVCDLNGFKEINDRYGHLAGDRVLKHFADLLRVECRACDYAARMGGDEFVIVTPSARPDLVNEIDILLNALVQQAASEICGEDHLSLSAGAAFYPQDGTDPEQLLAEADKKMYVVKKLYYGRRKLIDSNVA